MQVSREDVHAAFAALGVDEFAYRVDLWQHGAEGRDDWLRMRVTDLRAGLTADVALETSIRISLQDAMMLLEKRSQDEN